MYHEKQIKELCALHTLNNLFQNPSAFTKAALDNICFSLSPGHWMNPHKSVLGTGNYDINVIIAALKMKDCGVIWFDKRKDPHIVQYDKIIGIILNIPSEYQIGPINLPLKRKHWIAIRNLNGIFYNLDSKLNSPEIIGNEKELIIYLKEQLEHKEKELFLVVTNEVDRSKSWCNESTKNSTNTFSSHKLDSNDQIMSVDNPFNLSGLKYIDQEFSSLESDENVNIENNHKS